MNGVAATPVSNSLYPPDGPQSIGQVLDAGFRVFKASLVRCLLFGAMAMIAGQLPNIYSLATGQPFEAYLHGDPLTILLATIGSIATVYFSAVMLLRQREVAQGRRQSTRVELAHALQRLPALLGVAVVSLVLLGIVPVTLFMLHGAGAVSLSNQVGLLVSLGVIAVPVLWLLPGLATAAAVSVLTTSGPVASIRKGVALVFGSWWRTMITFAVWAVLLIVFNFIAVIIVVMAMGAIGATDVPTLAAGTQVVFVALRAIGLPFLVAIVLAVYGELRVRRDGVDLERRVAGVAQA